MARTPTPANAGEQTSTPLPAEAEGNKPPETPAETTSVETQVAEPVDDGELIEARVLRAFDGYEPNDIAELTDREVERLWRSGDVDPEPEAVEYAKSLIA